jgi:tetrahydromethanopterin S-methyltransferase subunit B
LKNGEKMKFSKILSIGIIILSTYVSALGGPIIGLVDRATGKEVPDADARYLSATSSPVVLNAITNNGFTINNIPVGNGSNITIAGGGTGSGLSNIAINNVWGTLHGSGSNIYSSVTLIPSDIGAVSSNTFETYSSGQTNINNSVSSALSSFTNQANQNSIAFGNQTNINNSVSSALNYFTNTINAVASTGNTALVIATWSSNGVTSISNKLWDSALTNISIVLTPGLNITINGGASPVTLRNGDSAIISSVGGGGGSGGGISNMVVNNVWGILYGSGSNVYSSITLVPSDIGAVGSNAFTLYASNQTNINNSVTSSLSSFTNLVNAVASTGNTALVIATWSSNSVIDASNRINQLNYFASNQTNINNSVGSALNSFTNQANQNSIAFGSQTNINNSVSSALNYFTNTVNAVASTGNTALVIATWSSNSVVDASNRIDQLNTFASNQTNVNNSVSSALNSFTNQANINSIAFENQTNVNNSVSSALNYFTNIVNAVASTGNIALAVAIWSSNSVVDASNRIDQLNTFASNQTNINNSINSALNYFTNTINAVASTGNTALIVATWSSNSVVDASNRIDQLNTFASNQTNVNNSVSSALNSFTNQANINGIAFENQTNVNNSVSSALNYFTNTVNAVASTGNTALVIATWSSNSVVDASNRIDQLNTFASNQTNVNNSVSSALNYFTNTVNAVASTGNIALIVATWSSNSVVDASNRIDQLNTFASNQTNVNNSVSSALNGFTNQANQNSIAFENQTNVNNYVASGMSSLTSAVNALQVGTVSTNDARYLAALTNISIILTPGLNVTINGGSSPVTLRNGDSATISSSGGGGGSGGGLSNIVVNNIWGTLYGSGSNVYSSVTLVPSDIGAITTNQLNSATNTIWVTVTNLNTITAINTTNYIGTSLDNTTNYINSVSNGITSNPKFVNSITNGQQNVNGTGFTNVNAATVGGLSAEQLMKVGVKYYFTTNLISYGVVTGRTTSLTAPTNTQEVIYTGGTNGTYLASYLIKPEDMPEILGKGTYSFEFNGYHKSNNRYPRIGGDLYIINASNGNVVQEFENTIGSVVNYSADNIAMPFSILIDVTNDIPKDGYAFLLRTKIVDNDGDPSIEYHSLFGKGYWSGFITPFASGIFTPTSEFNSFVNAAVTNYQTSVYLNTVNPPNGFENQTNQIVSFNPTTRQAVVAPVGSSFRVTAGYRTYTYNNAVTSSVGPNVAGGLFAYFRASDGEFICTNTPWAISGGEAQVIFAYLDTNTPASIVFTVDERHGVNISDEDHLMRHLTVGSTWASGMTISHFGADSATAAGANGTNTCIAINDAGIFYDEDVRHTTAINGSNGGATNTAGIFPILYKTTTGSWRKREGTWFPFAYSGNIPTYWNSAGVETTVAEDLYFVYWLVAYGSADGTNLFLVSHPTTYSSTANAQSGATFANFSSAIGGLPATEMLIAYRLIFQFNAAAPTPNPTSVKSSKLRSVDDYRNIPGGVILAGVGSGSGSYVLTSDKITAAGGALLTDLNSVSTALNDTITSSAINTTNYIGTSLNATTNYINSVSNGINDRINILNTFASAQTNVNNSISSALNGFTNQANQNSIAFENQTNVNNSVSSALNYFTNIVNAVASTGNIALIVANWSSNSVVDASNRIDQLNTFASNQTNINNSVSSALNSFTNQANINGIAFENQTNVNNSVSSALNYFTNTVNAVASTGNTALIIATWSSNSVVDASNRIDQLNTFASNQTNVNNYVASGMSSLTSAVNALQVGAVSTNDARYLAALTNYAATPFDSPVTIENTSPITVTSYFGHAYSRTFTSTGAITHVFLGDNATAGNEIYMETTATGLPARVWPVGYVFGYGGSISSNAPSPSPWAQMSVQKTPMGSIIWCITGQVWQAGTP